MLNADSGFHTELAQLPDQVPLATVQDYENYLSRLRQFPRVFDEWIALMRRGLARGMTPPRVAIAGVDATAAAHAVATPEESVLFKPFADFPATFAGRRARAAAGGWPQGGRARRCCPPTGASATSCATSTCRRAATTLAAADLPDGREYYRYLIRHFTTLDMTPEAIHELGLAQVARIRGEMDGVMKKTGFTGDFAAFLQFLRTDPRFYAKSAEELLKEASFIAKQMDGKLPALFHRLPRQPYGVAPVPAAMAPKYTSGRYVSAPVGGTQPGWYWVNTYALDKRPLYNLEALTFHEAVPGHHLQGALSQELEGLPQFRRFLYVDAFGEGWGLYSEWLGHRGRLLHRSVPRLRPARLRGLARLAAGRRHRAPCARLEPRAGDRLPRRQHHAAAARGHDRDRPLHLVARAGSVLLPRLHEDPRAPRARRGEARRGLRRARLPRRGARERRALAAGARTPDRRLHRRRARNRRTRRRRLPERRRRCGCTTSSPSRRARRRAAGRRRSRASRRSRFPRVSPRRRSSAGRSASSPRSRRPSARRARATIDYPWRELVSDLPQLVNLLYGNISLQRGIRIVGIDWPAELVGRFPGPAFGVAGLRELTRRRTDGRSSPGR